MRPVYHSVGSCYNILTRSKIHVSNSQVSSNKNESSPKCNALLDIPTIIRLRARALEIYYIREVGNACLYVVQQDP